MRATRTRTAMLLVALASFGWIGAAEDAGMRAIQDDSPASPSVFEVRQQCNQLAAFFTVDPAVADRWVPPAFHLAIDVNGQATGALIVLDCPLHYMLSTPNSPPGSEGENIAPASKVDFWFILQGPVEVLPVPGAQVTAPTQYAYSVADMVTSPLARRVLQRAGKNTILVDHVSLNDQGSTQTGHITFANGSKLTFTAYTPTQLPQPLRFGGNTWNWHVGGDGQVGEDNGVKLDSDSGNASNVNTTRVMFLALVPGPPNSTQVTIHAEPGTGFAKFYGTNDVVASRATFFRPNNIAINSSRGDLAWTTSPPIPIPLPPLFPW